MNSSTYINNEQHHASRTSQSPSTTTEAVPAAEYQEWPFQGFFKRTRIGSITSFNLDFHLTYVPERLELSGRSEALRGSIETSVQRQTSHNSVAQSMARC